MDKKIFEVEISSGGPESYKTSAVLTMPCTQAELHDALQKARVRVPYQIRHCLLVHAGVEQGGHIVMAKRVQVIFLWKSNGLIDFPQPFGP